uniref:Uncharacterized protein n=1 Tax=Anguilla anguilla TaxID=7936 RepID=A0A0E9WUG1_ANGAN
MYIYSFFVCLTSFFYRFNTLLSLSCPACLSPGQWVKREVWDLMVLF